MLDGVISEVGMHIWANSKKDSNSNFIQGNVFSENTKNSYFRF